MCVYMCVYVCVHARACVRVLLDIYLPNSRNTAFSFCSLINVLLQVKCLFFVNATEVGLFTMM